MSRRRQHQRALFEKRGAQERLKRALIPWMNEIIAEYRPGSTSVSQESKAILAQTLARFYNTTSRKVLKFDIRQFKQDENELERVVRRDISQELSTFFTFRTRSMTEKISQTAAGHVARTSKAAAEETWTATESRRALRNFLNNQRLTISTTEAQVTVETTRATAVRAVQDPLKNTIEQILALIEANDYNAANQLSRAVIKLAKLPVSVSQGDVINFISDNRDRLMTPRFQGQSLARIRKQAEKLQKEFKKWQSIGDSKVRMSHSIANAQEPIEINEPFILPGGALQWPGDSSLGASLTEIINCRCTAIYV